MLYLNTSDIQSVTRDWNQLAQVINTAVDAIEKKDFSQPIKPYLRFGPPENRIIAMPAFVGAEIDTAGIKWIASFPGNLQKNIKRANSITILNSSQTGIPYCMINTALISGIRTAAVSALIAQKFLNDKISDSKLIVGIAGFGPIGQIHAEMMKAILGKNLKEIRLFDINLTDQIKLFAKEQSMQICSSYEDAFSEADIFITATVSKQPYICLPPKKGSLHLNVSLRDYQADFFKYVDKIVVDNWEEVCRENTDVEMMTRYHGLTESDTYDIGEFLNLKMEKNNEVIMFNPMGLAVFDIAIAKYYFNRSVELGLGTFLTD